MRDLRGQGDDGLCRLGPAFRRVAVVASRAEVGLAGRFVALRALERQRLVAGVAIGACQFCVGALQGYRMVDGSGVHINILKPFGRVAVLADALEVGFTGRLVALSAVVGQFLTCAVATRAGQFRVGALQGHRVFEAGQICLVKPFGRVAVLAFVTKVGLSGRLVA
jgi:hypothetical protein